MVEKKTTSSFLKTEITHAVTLRGSLLNYQILTRQKPVENRNFKIPSGWVALHNNAQKKEESGEKNKSPSAIVGAVRFAHAVPIELLPEDISPTHREHCFGPQCNVVAEVQFLSKPILGVKGALGIWKLKPHHATEIALQLATGESQITHFDTREFRPPTEAQMRSWRADKKRERELLREKREEIRSMKRAFKENPSMEKDIFEFAKKMVKRGA